jgi:hypothetical protein
MSVDGRGFVPQYTTRNENTPRVGSAEGAEQETNRLRAVQQMGEVAVPILHMPSAEARGVCL